MRLFLVALLLLAVASVLASPVASAQDRRVRLLLEEEKIVGKVQKPEVQMFISRQNLNTDATLVLRESFVPRIVESLEKRPF